MKKNILIFWITIVTISVTLFSACREKVTGIMINKSELEFAPGDTEILIATVQPNNASNDKVIWTSNNMAVATVTDGLVTAIYKGDAIITATTKEGNHTATCSVNVDYRNKWIGNWDFDVKKHIWQQGENGFSIRDTIDYLGKIGIIKSSNNQLSIECEQDLGFSTHVDEEGIFSRPVSPNYDYFWGNFIGTDSIHIYIGRGGLGGGTFYNVDGTKMKGGKNE